MKILPILSICPIGNAEFQRFLIADNRGRYWTGKRFTTHEEDAIRYADHGAAATDVQEILKRCFRGKTPARYIVPVFIEVFSDKPVPVAAVVQHLSKTSSLYLNTPKHGNGPNGSLVLPVIDWGRIEVDTREENNEQDSEKPSDVRDHLHHRSPDEDAR